MTKTIGVLGGIDFANLIKIWDDYKAMYIDEPAIFLCHLDTQRKLIELLENYCQQSGIKKVTNIFGVDVYESKYCPPGEIRIIPHKEWLVRWPKP